MNRLPFLSGLVTGMLVALAGCGDGGRHDAPLTREIALTQAGTIVPFADTGRRAGDADMDLQFGLVFEDYFRCVHDGHAGVMARASLEQIPTGQYRGVGLVFGRFGMHSYTTRNMPHLKPVAVIETWGVGAVPDDFNSLLVQTISPELQDWTPYQVSLHLSGDKLLGYSMADAHGLVIQTGPLVDLNPAVDMTAQAIAFFDATGQASCNYTIRIVEPTATWSPDSGLPDLSAVPWRRP